MNVEWRMANDAGHLVVDVKQMSEQCICHDKHRVKPELSQ